MNLSIIIPAYNVERYIGSTLGSLRRQTARDFEVVVVDDGSTDGTAEAAERHLDGLPEARLIRTSNGGVSQARNVGLAAARGDYVLFLDGDDYVGETLAARVAAATNSLPPEQAAPDAVVWRFVEVDEAGNMQSDFFRDKPALPERLEGAEVLNRIFFHRNLRVHTAGVAYRRERLLEANLSYTPGCVNGEDQEFIYKALCRAREVRFIDESLLFYVQRGSSVTYTYNVRKFDFVGAFERTARDLRERGSSELHRIADRLDGPYLLEDYLYTIRTCLSGGKVPMYRLLADVERQYPGLNARMRDRIRGMQAEGGTLPRALRLFAASPSAYGLLLQAKRSARKIRGGRKTGAAAAVFGENERT